jgi:cellobiose-specific phosphotransferase system component IIB
LHKQTGLQQQVEKLEIELYNAELARKGAQTMLDQASEQMSVKVMHDQDIQLLSPEFTENFHKVSDLLKSKTS